MSQRRNLVTGYIHAGANKIYLKCPEGASGKTLTQAADIPIELGEEFAASPGKAALKSDGTSPLYRDYATRRTGRDPDIYQRQAGISTILRLPGKRLHVHNACMEK